VSENKPSPKEKEDPATKRILILDDDESVRHMLQATLEVEGFKVKVARDGRGVVQTARQFNPNLVVSDLMMPNGGGFELVRALQGDPDTARIPVLLISGRGFDDSTKAMFKQESNVIGFVEKPIRAMQFTNRIHEILHTFTKQEMMTKEREKNAPKLDDDRFRDLM
jgi:two-component system phosphate regulon response regulator PhoB